MVYGKGQVFDADRLIDVPEAFETFSVASRTSRVWRVRAATAATTAAAPGGFDLNQIFAQIQAGLTRPPPPPPRGAATRTLRRARRSSLCSPPRVPSSRVSARRGGEGHRRAEQG